MWRRHTVTTTVQVGPSSEGCALGGALYWAAALHMFGPLPFRPGRGGIGDLFR